MPPLRQILARMRAIPSIRAMRGPTGVATTDRATRLKRTPLAASTRTERIPRSRTIHHAPVQQTARRMHVPSLRVILLQTDLTTRQELITRVRTQLIGPLHSIRPHNGRRLHRDKSRARPGLRLNNSTVLLVKKASPKVAIHTQSRNNCAFVGLRDGPFDIRMARFFERCSFQALQPVRPLPSARPDV